MRVVILASVVVLALILDIGWVASARSARR